MIATLVLISMLLFNGTTEKPMKIDFGNGPDKSQEWVLLSDNVMGGVTKSNLTYTTNSVVLTGEISFRNFGGFSSTRTRFHAFDLSAFKGVKIRFKSVNQKFAFTLEDSRNWMQPNYKCAFASTKPDTWEEVILYFANFKQYVIGRSTGGGMDSGILKDVVRLGIMTDEKKEGPFSIEIDYVEFIN
ncbi:MAG: hypothetical protein FGM32_01190 [Candidatus Kapabacteria bacterium]|nr:hypothetical protein [Candidatus Kapabacteria bacterium]